ncbi:hypothetical protein [Streptomyces chrestomyceticus]|uniref:hypothetical protein n=1 Tax=Streptomyces chrestomyceticus TaxID=68185 RepID=UPI0037884842
MIEELAGPWTARCESALHERRSGKRKQQPGAGPKHDLVFTDRVLVTLAHLHPTPARRSRGALRPGAVHYHPRNR